MTSGEYMALDYYAGTANKQRYMCSGSLNPMYITGIKQLTHSTLWLMHTANNTNGTYPTYWLFGSGLGLGSRLVILIFVSYALRAQP